MLNIIKLQSSFFGLCALLPTILHASLDESLECLIEPSKVIEISSEVPGVIDSIAVERGSYVKKGQLIVKLKSGAEQSAVDLARARLDFSKRKSVRNEDLYQKQLISIHEKDEMETERLLAELELDGAERKLSMRAINSPINGIVLKRNHSTGEYVTTDPILTVVSINPLYVEVIAPLNLLGTVKPGMKAKVFTDFPVKGEYTGKVTIVDKVVDAASGTFGIRVRLANRGNKIPAGIKCQVSFE